MADRISVIVVDDEPLARRGVRGLLEKEKHFEIVGECRNGREAVAATKALSPDLIFLDINMPLLDGFAFIEKISPEKLPEIVFVTAYDEHAVRAFEAGAIDYVLKPIDAERFRKTLERVRRRILSHEETSLKDTIADLLSSLKSVEENYLQRIAVKENERIHFLYVEKVECICSQGNYVELNSEGGTFLVRETMDGIEKKLNPQEFVRIRRATIVRIDQIKVLNQLFNGEFEVVLKNGMKFSSSRRYRHNLNSLLKS